VPHVAQLQQSREHTCQYGPMLSNLELGAEPVTIGREAEMYSGQYCSGQTDVEINRRCSTRPKVK
jgi:hypothetical protein